jgi:hypothetical protein
VNIRHHPDLVRMNLADGSLHCNIHGLLPPDEADDVLHRVGLAVRDAREVDTLSRTHPLLRLRMRVLDALTALRRPKCEYLA